ncbi:hypothetical protein EXIGLDRAFT_112291 [Exidia glandulosa HHB12029]|uniref:Uncharacterized protein n=1 Tax=Exidia glandulosa HHB12029 TaxID=1314781 RepID=A0A165NLV6_EXIGL|nr:hypothetical protein EXIGLDRAFT_112291 [Exidia glandulosa HHB12029]
MEGTILGREDPRYNPVQLAYVSHEQIKSLRRASLFLGDAATGQVACVSLIPNVFRILSACFSKFRWREEHPNVMFRSGFSSLPLALRGSGPASVASTFRWRPCSFFAAVERSSAQVSRSRAGILNVATGTHYSKSPYPLLPSRRRECSPLFAASSRL